MLVVGLTGGIASGAPVFPTSAPRPERAVLMHGTHAGKSTVSQLLKDHRVPVIDLDILARVAVEPDSYALSALVRHFGKEILRDDGTLNREKLGNVVFSNEKERKVLNSIVHPAVRRLLAWELVKAWFRGEKLCVVDAPLLIEAGLWKLCGAIVVVYCSEILQLQRLRSRNNLSLSDAQARLSAQAPLSSKLKYADFVIDNSGPLADLTNQVERVVARLNDRAGWSWVLSWLCPPVGIVRAVLRVGWRLWVKGVGKDKSRRTRGERRPESIELKDRSNQRRSSEAS